MILDVNDASIIRAMNIFNTLAFTALFFVVADNLIFHDHHCETLTQRPHLLFTGSALCMSLYAALPPAGKPPVVFHPYHADFRPVALYSEWFTVKLVYDPDCMFIPYHCLGSILASNYRD